MESLPPAQWVNEVNPHLQSKRSFCSTITLLLVFPKILKYRSILRQNSFIFGHYLIFKMECLPAVPEGGIHTHAGPHSAYVAPRFKIESCALFTLKNPSRNAILLPCAPSSVVRPGQADPIAPPPQSGRRCTDALLFCAAC